jgi:hypothetical protein
MRDGRKEWVGGLDKQLSGPSFISERIRPRARAARLFPTELLFMIQSHIDFHDSACCASLPFPAASLAPTNFSVVDCRDSGSLRSQEVVVPRSNFKADSGARDLGASLPGSGHQPDVLAEPGPRRYHLPYPSGVQLTCQLP